MLRWRVLHLPLPGAEWSSEDGSCPSRGMQGARGGAARATSQRREPQYQEGGTSKLTKGVAEVLCGTHPGLCGRQACDNRPMPRGSRRVSPEDHHPEVLRAAWHSVAG